MQHVIFGERVFEPETWTAHDVEDVREFLTTKFAHFPPTARIYHRYVAQTCDVTPCDEASIERLGKLEGTIYVLNYPGDPITAIIVAVVAIVAIAALLFLMPRTPNALSNQVTGSSNNGLSDRQNTQRIGGRIPDIVGTVRSIPDLLAVPYKVFENNIQYEYAYTCVGRGFYVTSDHRDGDTLVTSIANMSMEIYDPGTSPNDAIPTPSTLIGTAIGKPVRNVARSNSVNGQEMHVKNWKHVNVAGEVGAHVKFQYATSSTGTILSNDDDSLDYTDFFENGDVVVIGPTCTETHSGVTFNGTGPVTVLTVISTQLSVTIPAGAQQTQWAKLNPFSGHGTAYMAASLDGTNGQNNPIGPFVIDNVQLAAIIFNFVAPQGLYRINGHTQTALTATFDITIQQCDAAGVGFGTIYTYNESLAGSALARSLLGWTVEITLPFNGYAIVSVARTDLKDYTFAGTTVDVVNWQDMYGVSVLPAFNPGNVTTVWTKTQANASSLSVKERKQNMLAQRMVPQRIGSTSTFTTVLAGSNSADDILCFLAMDPYNGNRTVAELDVTNIYDTIAAVKAYFGTSLAGEFNYSFDSSNLSYEEQVATIADAVFCVAYRRGNQMKLSFERQTANSTLLFNHRNKVPATETRSLTLGNQNDYDGVAYTYIDPDGTATLGADNEVTIYLPNSAAKNAEKIKSVGIRSRANAWFHATRRWNKIQHQHWSIQFDGMQEADMLIRNDRILCADNTSKDTQDGEVITQVGLILTLSQNVNLTGGGTWSIYLQLYDGSTENILITAVGGHPNQVTLAAPPTLPLVIDQKKARRTRYTVTNNTSPRVIACLVTETDPIDTYSSTVICADYQDAYYANDGDFIAGTIP